MRILICLALILPYISIQANAVSIKAPPVPDAGIDLMPNDTGSFPDALMELFRKSVSALYPELEAVVRSAVFLLGIVLIISIIQRFHTEKNRIINIAAAAMITSILINDTNTLIRLGADTITELSEYGKLLLPVMTAAMAGQGGITTSTSLYAGTAVFDLVLTGLISKYLLPGMYIFLVFAIANSAIGEDVFKKFRDMIKSLISWSLKTLLTVFTTYMSITKVISGTTDAAALKTAKMTISSTVPVVGGILSDASEAVLVSAQLVKNAAGVYGILAVLAVFLAPFLRLWINYLVLKASAALCGVFAAKPQTDLIEDFASAMGLLLAMTASVCLLLLISTVCFMKVVI